MPPKDDKSYIEELKKSLYSRTAPDVRTKRKNRFDISLPEVKTDWGHQEEPNVTPESLNKEYKKPMSFFTKLLIASGIFCVIAVSIGAYLFFNGANLISANNIDIRISGPVSIPGGVPVTFDVTIFNKNNVDLQLVDMSVDFPAGATKVDDPSQPLTNYQVMIGDIPVNGTAHKSISAIIFGEENLQKSISVTLTYSVKGSTAVFTKTQTYDVLINSSPINVTVSSFKEITSGQEFDLKVNLKSNSQQVLKNVLLKANYPFGYSFLSASMATLPDNATWKIGDIPAGSSRSITIRGKLTGEDSDLRVFRFLVGAQSPNDPKNIGTQYMSLEQDMVIQKPFISLGLTVDNEASGIADHVGQFNYPERVVVDWSNNLPVTVSNVAISVKISGTAYDKNFIQPDQGTFDSVNNVIVWDQRTNPELASVEAGDTGRVTFTITPKNTGTINNPVINPIIHFEVGVRGNRIQESNVPLQLSAALAKNIKISSTASLSGRIVRTSGPFANLGPIPPKAEKETTYTVIWDVDNTSSLVGNAQVSATLPPYIKWLDVVSPGTENITYDKNTGQVTWNVGTVGTYTLGSSGRREVAFQVSFTPSVNQIDQNPALVNRSTLKAVDNFTNTQLTSEQEYLTTRFSTDPAYRDGDETVAR